MGTGQDAQTVSIHASAREATGIAKQLGTAFSVSIHASAREATGPRAARPATSKFQSTPPHGRRLSAEYLPRSYSGCFNPRLRTGGDPGVIPALLIYDCFNPRLRTGGDADDEPLSLLTILVSIHASAREATRLAPASMVRWSCFNPRLRTGGDPGPARRRLDHARFQSTPPHGRRPIWALRAIDDCPVSIHASAREATVTGVGL